MNKDPTKHNYVSNGASRDPCCAICGKEAFCHKKKKRKPRRVKPIYKDNIPTPKDKAEKKGTCLLCGDQAMTSTGTLCRLCSGEEYGDG
jgi:hypothetical protein